MGISSLHLQLDLLIDPVDYSHKKQKQHFLSLIGFFTEMKTEELTKL